MGRQKRKLLIFIVMLALSSLMLVACSADQQDGEETPSTEVDAMDTEGTAETGIEDDVRTDEEAVAEGEMATATVTSGTGDETSTPSVTAGDEGGTATPQGQADINRLISTETLVGLNLVSQAGTELGEVTDALFDVQGQMHYLIVRLDAADDHTVAVEWDLLQPNVAGTETMEPTEESTDSQRSGQSQQQIVTLVYLGEEVDIEEAPEVDSAVLTQEGASVVPLEVGLEADFERLLQVSELDYNLISENNDDVGEVEELLVNVQEGKVIFAVTDIGGFVGVDEQTVAIPWERLQLNENTDEFTVNANQEELQNAPRLDIATLQSEGQLDPNSEREARSYWNIDTAS